jgi:uncharacterized UPF0160 family protein
MNMSDILVDVGGEYDESKNKYDHHQEGFDQNFFGQIFDFDREDSSAVLLSSAGLIYRKYGQQILYNIANLMGSRFGNSEEEEDENIRRAHYEVYNDIIKEVDAQDNGIDMFPSKYNQRYNINTGLSSRIKRLNPKWNSEDKNNTKAFLKAMDLVEEEFLEQVNFRLNTIRPAYDIVKEAYESRYNFHHSGELILLKQPVPWKAHLTRLEYKNGNMTDKSVKYAIYQTEDGMYKVHAVSEPKAGFQSKVPLVEEWRGKSEEDLRNITGLQSIKFTHHKGFIGG